MVLDLPALALLDLSGVQLLEESLLKQLAGQLSAERDVTVYVGGRWRCRRCWYLVPVAGHWSVIDVGCQTCHKDFFVENCL